MRIISIGFARFFQKKCNFFYGFYGFYNHIFYIPINIWKLCNYNDVNFS